MQLFFDNDLRLAQTVTGGFVEVLPDEMAGWQIVTLTGDDLTRLVIEPGQLVGHASLAETDGAIVVDSMAVLEQYQRELLDEQMCQEELVTGGELAAIDRLEVACEQGGIPFRQQHRARRAALLSALGQMSYRQPADVPEQLRKIAGLRFVLSRSPTETGEIR